MAHLDQPRGQIAVGLRLRTVGLGRHDRRAPVGGHPDRQMQRNLGQSGTPSFAASLATPPWPKMCSS